MKVIIFLFKLFHRKNTSYTFYHHKSTAGEISRDAWPQFLIRPPLAIDE